MPVVSIVAVFLVVWWISFVAVLPIGARSQHEAGDIVTGTEPGAPVTPALIRRMLAATAVAAILTALLFWGLSNETLYRYWNR